MARSLKTSGWNLYSLVAAVLVSSVAQHSHAQECPVPSNLVAPVVVYNSITFRWDVTKYVPNPVHCTCMSQGNYGESCSSGSTPKVCTINVSGYTRTQPSLVVYTNYTMCVQTQCSTTNFSNPVCKTFRTSPTAPSPPHQVFVDKHSPSSLDVNWRFPVTLNGPLDGYRVRWCQTSRCVMSEEELRGPDRRAFRITGLEPYRQYNVYVSGFNVDANSGNTLYGGDTSLSEYTLPTYPSEPSLTFTKVSTSQVNVVVGVPKYPNGPINGYVLTWCPKRRCYGDYVGTRELLMSNAGTQSITGLQPWTEYEVSVKAFNTVPTNAERAYSEDVNATVVPMPYSPPGPQSFKATPLSSTSIKLTWDLPARFNLTPSHYRVFWCTIGDKFCFNQDYGNVREAIVAPLEPYTEYRFMIKALVQFSSPWLNSAVSSTNARTWAADPGRPEELRIVRAEATLVAVSWKAPLEPQGPVDGYRVRICPELGTCPPIGLVSRWTTIPRTAYNKTFYGIQPYTNYQVQVKAFNNLPDEKTAEGDVAVVAVSTRPSEPSEPRNLVVDTINSTSLQVTWKPPSHKNGPVKGYRISWWKSGGPESHGLEDKSSNGTVFLPGEASLVVLGGLEPYTTYAVQVARVNRDGNSTREGAAAHAEGVTDPEPSPPPTNVTVNAVKFNATASKLVCNWAPPNVTTEPAVQGYLLRVCAVHEISMCWKANTTAQKLSHVFEVVPNFEDYILEVNAFVLNHGRRVVGNAATAEVSTDAPNIPSVKNVTATAINSTSLLVEWNPTELVQDLDTVYNVTLLHDKNGTAVFEVFVSDARAVFEDLEAWTEYSVQVSACLKRGSKRQCGTASVIVVRTPPTGASEPTGVRTSSNSTAIDVSWGEPFNPNGPLQGYNVTWWLAVPTPNQSVDGRPINKTSVFLKGAVFTHVITGLEEESVYVVEILRVNGQGSSVWYGVPARIQAMTTTKSYPKPEGARYVVRQLNATLFSIIVTWQLPSDAPSGAVVEGYQVFVQRVEAGKTPVTSTFEVAKAELAFNVSDLNPFVEYVVRIRAYVRFADELVRGDAAELWVSVDARTLLVVSEVAAMNSADGAVTVSWNSSASAKVGSETVVYEVKVFVSETGIEVEGTEVQYLHATFTSLNQNTNYTVQVKACDVRGHSRKCGDPSKTSFTTSKEDPTPRPKDVHVIPLNSTTLKVTWEMPTHSHGVTVTGYRVQWWQSTSNLTGTAIKEEPIVVDLSPDNVWTFTITELDAYKTYDVEIAIFYVENGVSKNVSVYSKGTTYPKPSSPPMNIVFKLDGPVGNYTRVVISWKPPQQSGGPDVDGYRIELCPVGNDHMTLRCQDHNTSSTTFAIVLEGLNRFETYTAFVSAYTSYQGMVINGDSGKTFVSADPKPLLKIDGLKIDASSQENVTVSWNAVDISSTRWSLLYRVTARLRNTSERVFVKDLNTTQVTLALPGEDTVYVIRVKACLVRGSVKPCGEPSSANVKPSEYVGGRQLVKIETVNSSAILVELHPQSQRQESFEGIKITWSLEKPSSDEAKPDDSITVFVPNNQSSFVITGLSPFEHYKVTVAEVYTTSDSRWETVISSSEAVTDPKPYPPPTGVTHKSTSSGSSSSLVINWNAPQTFSGPPIEGYEISVCPHSDSTSGPTCRNFNTSASSLHVEVSGLKSFAEYDVEVKAYVINNGRIVYGDVTRSVVSTNAPPVPPIEGAAVWKALEGGSVTLSWNQPDQVRGFDVVYDLVLAEKASGRIVSRTEVNVTKASFEGLVSSVEYVASITICLVSKVRRQCGNATDVTFHAVYTGDDRQPIHLHMKSASHTTLLVTWPEPAENGSRSHTYVVFWRKMNDTAASESLSFNQTLPANTTSFLISDLEPNTTYQITVSRIHGGNYNDTTDSEQVTATTQPDPYQEPGGVSASVEKGFNSSRVTVTWNAFPVRQEDSPVIGYDVTLCPLAGNEAFTNDTTCQTTTLPANDSKVEFTFLKGFYTYRVEVSAIIHRPEGGTDRGAASIISFTTPPPAIPSLLDSLRSELNGSHVAVFWRRPAGLEEYEVLYYVKLLRPVPQQAIERTSKATVMTFDSLEAGSNYTVEVATCIVSGRDWHCAGNTTLEFEAIPEGNLTDTVNLTVQALSTTEMQVHWDSIVENEYLKSYEVSWWRQQPSDINSTSKNTSTVPATTTTIVVGELEPYTDYTVQLTALYERRNVTWQGNPVQTTISTTSPVGFPNVTKIVITTTNRTHSYSDIIVTWELIEALSTPSTHLECRVRLCMGLQESMENCHNQTVSCHRLSATFPRVQNFASVLVTVQPVVKTANTEMEGELALKTGVSWTPSLSSVSGLTLTELTENSASLSWSNVNEIDGVDGAYYKVVLSVKPELDLETTLKNNQTQEYVEQNATALPTQRGDVSSDAALRAHGEEIVQNLTTTESMVKLLHLTPWRNYTVTVSPGVRGPGLEFVGNESAKDFETPPGKPGKPRNVTVSQRDGDHILTWLPPTSWNGPRSGYEVGWSCMKDGVRGNKTTVTLNADRMALSLPGLSSGVPCTVSINAFSVYQEESLEGKKVNVPYTPPAVDKRLDFVHPTIHK